MKPPAPGNLTISPYDRDDHLIAASCSDGQAQVSVYPYRAVAVILGRGGKPEVELHVVNILADGVRVLKRPGGGCAVVLDPGNVIVTVVLPLPGIGGITTAFQRLSTEVIAALARVGIADVRQHGVSDLALGDLKIGGACIYRTRGLLFYSTTLLVDPDLNLVERYLRHPPREPEYRRRRPHRRFMGRLRDVLGNATATTLALALKQELPASRFASWEVR